MKNSDLQTAKANLAGHTICLCKNESIITDNSRGIAPMMKFIADGKDLNGFSVADLIVGKAAAGLFVKCGIIAVYAKVLSEAGKEFLEKYGVYYEYETLTSHIINRNGTDVCPMEKAVTNLDDPRKMYLAITDKIAELKKHS